MLRILRNIALFVSVFFVFPHVAHAGAWGETWSAMYAKQAMEEIWQAMQDAALAAAKQAALTILSTAVNNMIGGETGRMITDYVQYLYLEPSFDALDAVLGNDGYVFYATNGRFSSTHYADVAGDILNGNYDRALFNMAKNAVGEVVSPYPNVNEYCVGKTGNSTDTLLDPFDTSTGRGMGNTLQCLDAIMDIHPTQFILDIQNQKRVIEEQIRDARRMEQDRGYLPTKTENGLIATPGSLTADMHSEAMTLPMKAMAAANSIPEIAAGIATRVAAQVVTQGVNKITAKIQRKVDQTTRKWGDGFKEKMGFKPGELADMILEPSPGPQPRACTVTDNNGRTYSGSCVHREACVGPDRYYLDSDSIVITSGSTQVTIRRQSGCTTSGVCCFSL